MFKLVFGNLTKAASVPQTNSKLCLPNLISWYFNFITSGLVAQLLACKITYRCLICFKIIYKFSNYCVDETWEVKEKCIFGVKIYTCTNIHNSYNWNHLSSLLPFTRVVAKLIPDKVRILVLGKCNFFFFL